ncbi:hypothetical protein IC575_008482 [Cucumis melo]
MGSSASLSFCAKEEEERLWLYLVNGRLIGTDQMPSTIVLKHCIMLFLVVPSSMPNRREHMMSKVRVFINGATCVFAKKKKKKNNQNM